MKFHSVKWRIFHVTVTKSGIVVSLYLYKLLSIVFVIMRRKLEQGVERHETTISEGNARLRGSEKFHLAE